LDFGHWTFWQLLRKEKDEASPTIRCRQDSLNAFIPRFAGVWRFFILAFKLRSGLSTQNRFANFFLRNKIERSAECKKSVRWRSPACSLSAALGAPALGGSVTPFAPPYSKSQLVSIGAGGQITLQMSSPIVNDPSDPYGINFIFFANEFFVNSSSGVSGLYFHSASLLVQVSADAATWFTLNPVLAPPAGQLFPTDGSGNPQIAVNPSLTAASFTGLNLAGIESLYAGSAGGTGYQLAWAQDANSNSVNLASADYVRIEVQSGVLDLDAIAAVPEPATGTLALAGIVLLGFSHRNKKTVRLHLLLLPVLLAASTGRATTLVEKFATDPALAGWQVFGDTNRFQWDSTNQVLDVTWDSTQPNSYFYHPLGVTLTTNDSFCVQFDLQVTNATASGYGFELAIGLLHLADATNADFNRANSPSPNLFEFDYFPADAFGDAASLDATLKDSQLGYAGFYFAYDDQTLNPGTTYRVVLIHRAGTAAIQGAVYLNGQVFTLLPNIYANGPTNFQLDTLSINNYTDDGYGDSAFAQGTVANLAFATPLPVDQINTSVAGQIQFASDTNWLYTLQESTNLQTWTPAAPAVFGNGTNLILSATNAPAGQSFYRVRADLP
jgi:hypothetical protein